VKLSGSGTPRLSYRPKTAASSTLLARADEVIE
jgi:hypothetical protein